MNRYKHSPNYGGPSIIQERQGGDKHAKIEGRNTVLTLCHMGDNEALHLGRVLLGLMTYVDPPLKAVLQAQLEGLEIEVPPGATKKQMEALAHNARRDSLIALGVLSIGTELSR